MARRLKTNRAALKRFRRSNSGKIKVRRAKRNHNFTHERQKVKRQRRAQGILKGPEHKRVVRILRGE